VENRIIGSNRTALKAAFLASEESGLVTEILPTPVTGEAAAAGRMLARLALERATQRSEGPLCLLSGGETTVTVRGGGKGGRNQELALSFALEIAGKTGITLLSAGTDGTDGPTDAAGALVDGDTIPAAARESALRSLTENDSYSFFKEHGGLFITGPTGTNVMDMQIILIR
jgi:glycerate-2-kinase